MFESEQICPYTGLRAFTEEESLYFKGREEDIDQTFDAGPDAQNRYGTRNPVLRTAVRAWRLSLAAFRVG